MVWSNLFLFSLYALIKTLYSQLWFHEEPATSMETFHCTKVLYNVNVLHTEKNFILRTVHWKVLLEPFYVNNKTLTHFPKYIILCSTEEKQSYTLLVCMTKRASNHVSSYHMRPQYREQVCTSLVKGQLLLNISYKKHTSTHYSWVQQMWWRKRRSAESIHNMGWNQTAASQHHIHQPLVHTEQPLAHCFISNTDFSNNIGNLSKPPSSHVLTGMSQKYSITIWYTTSPPPTYSATGNKNIAITRIIEEICSA